MKIKFTKKEFEMLREVFLGAIDCCLSEKWVEMNKEKLEKILDKLYEF